MRRQKETELVPLLPPPPSTHKRGVVLLWCARLCVVGSRRYWWRKEPTGTEPIKEVAAVIHKAAFLLVDDIPPTHSFIQEVNVIMRSVSVMFTNVKEYKSYLPMHVRAVAAHALETESSASEDASATEDSRSRSTDDSGTVSEKVSAAFVLAAPVVKKNVSLTLTNVKGYADTTKESPALCKSAHRAALEVLLPLFSKYRGMPESFTGDKFVCTFNASKPAADHRLAAARVALALQEESCDLSVNTALTTGNCRVGTLGTAEMMKLSVIGPIMQWVFVSSASAVCRVLPPALTGRCVSTCLCSSAAPAHSLGIRSSAAK